MKEVYFQGRPYPFKVIGDVAGKRQFMLFENGVLKHFVEEKQVVKKKSFVQNILEAYYNCLLDFDPSLREQDFGRKNSTQ